MAASQGIIGKGTSLGYADTAGGTFTAVGEVIDVSVPDLTVGEDVEFTHYLSDNNYKEYKPGWQELGEGSFQVNFVKTQYATLCGLTGITKFWKVTTMDGSADVFPAYIKKISKVIPIKDRITVTVTLRPTAGNTFTAGA